MYNIRADEKISALSDKAHDSEIGSKVMADENSRLLRELESAKQKE